MIMQTNNNIRSRKPMLLNQCRGLSSGRVSTARLIWSIIATRVLYSSRATGLSSCSFHPSSHAGGSGTLGVCAAHQCT